MDDIVKQAMARWPNVPACFGWLGLDARGQWFLRDDAVQALGAFPQSKGSLLEHEKLLAFIARNYASDDFGRWFFQNGPQRVYVNLEATPFIARTDPQQGLLLQTGQALTQVEHVYLSDAGAVLFVAGDIVAQLDDRDVAQVLGQLQLAGSAASDDDVMAWLDGGNGALTLPWNGASLAVERVTNDELQQRFGFNQRPAP